MTPVACRLADEIAADEALALLVSYGRTKHLGEAQRLPLAPWAEVGADFVDAPPGRPRK